MSDFIPELLAPAGGPEQLESAILYGADAVFLGGKNLNLRKASIGFDHEELNNALEYAHKNSAKIFYCVNAIPQNHQLNDIAKELEYLSSTAIDGLIIADPGVMNLAKRYAPNKEIHLSTQAHTTNIESIKFWKDQGVSRVNLARELDQETIKELRQNIDDVEFEVFVHGAMCLALSGHCLLSAWVNKRHANLGHCTQPCRFQYRGGKVNMEVEEVSRKDSPLWHIEQDEQYAAMYAPDDLCLIRYMKWFSENKIHALKIEGRTKSGSYVAQVVNVYRTALNALTDDESLNSYYVHELNNIASRKLSTGFFLPERIDQTSEFTEKSSIVARISNISKDKLELDIRSPWDIENKAEILLPGLKTITLPANEYKLENHRGEFTERLHPGVTASLFIDSAHFAEHINDLKTGLYIRTTK